MLIGAVMMDRSRGHSNFLLPGYPLEIPQGFRTKRCSFPGRTNGESDFLKAGIEVGQLKMKVSLAQ